MLRAISLFLAVQAATGRTAAQPPTPPAVTPAEWKVIEACLATVRNCQRPDGAFTMVNHGSAPTAPVWVAPYFADHAALALLAAHGRKASPADVGRVGRWLDWRVRTQTPGGYWYDHVGTAAGYASNGKVDAHDSSAALFLLALDRYRLAGGKVTANLVTANRRAVRCIAGLTDDDGLTWAKSDYRVKYLMDNVEVYGGLVAAAQTLEAAGDKTLAAECRGRAAGVAGGLRKFWEARAKGRFAWAMHPTGTYDGGFDLAYPHGLAQLFGVSFVQGDATCFADTAKAFPPQTGVEAAAGAERFLIAAARVGGREATDWRGRVVAAARAFDPAAVYLHRPAVAVLGLLEGADWIPSVLAPPKKQPGLASNPADR